MVPFLNKGPAISAQHGISMRMIFHKKDVLSVQHPTELHPNLAIVVARNRQLNRDKLRVHSSFMMVPMQCGWCIPIHYITSAFPSGMLERRYLRTPAMSISSAQRGDQRSSTFWSLSHEL